MGRSWIRLKVIRMLRKVLLVSLMLSLTASELRYERPRGYSIKKDTYLWGRTTTNLYHTTVQACVAACDSASSCLAFYFLKEGPFGRCSLKSSITDTQKMLL